MKIYSKVITLKNGRRLIANQYGLEAFCFEVTEEQYQAYLERQRKKKEKAEAEKTQCPKKKTSKMKVKRKPKES